MKKFAQIVSIVFEPYTVSFVALVLVTHQLPVSTEEKIGWFFAAVALGGLPALAVYLYERKIGKIHDVFITNRLERRDVQLAWFLGSGAFFLVALAFDAPRLLLALSLTLVVLSFLITLISLYWKVSVHMVGVTLFVTLLLLCYSVSTFWLLILLPLVAWARVRLGQHTLSQVTVATIMTIAVTYSVFYLFGLASF
ncbi:MAG TPA: hypothetical protein VLE47_04680 [Candidatus Saccharimonadales bacterium]|nr:hypothetical protein [Candidatus Saccharimonadales bacterium]